MSAALTTPEAKDLRPASALAALLMAAVLIALVGLAVSRTAPSQPAAPAVNDQVVVGNTGIPYVGTGPAADTIRGDYGLRPTVPMHIASDPGIPYVGTGPAADAIRAALNDRTGLPHNAYFDPEFWSHGK